MIITKHNLRLLVGVLVIYCCIETIVGASVHGVFNEDESTPDTTLSPTQTDQSSDPTTPTTVSPTEKPTRPKIHHPTSMMPHRKTTTTSESSPSTTPA